MNEISKQQTSHKKGGDSMTNKQKPSNKSYVISVSLFTGCYRHIRISADDTLADLHSAILDAFGFIDDQAHAFFMDNKAWSGADSYSSLSLGGHHRPTQKHALLSLGLVPGKAFKYVFGFDDGCHFQLKVLKVLEESTDRSAVIRQKGDAHTQHAWNKDDRLVNFPEIYPPKMIKSLYKALPLPESTVNLLIQYFNAFSNLYWIIPLHKALDIFNRQNPAIGETHFLKFAQVARHDDQFFHIMGEDELYADYHKAISPMDRLIINRNLFVADEDKLPELQRNQEGKPYYVPPKEELLKYQDELYFEKNTAFFALRDYLLKGRRLSRERAEGIADELQLIAYMGDADNPQSVHDLVEDMGYTFRSMEDLEQFFQLFFTLSNNTRMPSNRGYTPEEMKKLSDYRPTSIILKDGYKKAIRDGVMNIQELRAGVADMGFPTVEMQISFLNELDRIQKELEAESANTPGKQPLTSVSRNASCPCGSGRKYKHCCGKDKPLLN